MIAENPLKCLAQNWKDQYQHLIFQNPLKISSFQNRYQRGIEK